MIRPGGPIPCVCGVYHTAPHTHDPLTWLDGMPLVDTPANPRILATIASEAPS